ncbi:MAG: hypothetical protein KF845_01485 [Cyclobacteriaceae bacterium]|nr:hypothetical protein [Cyclobacteriaceae bacterium]
MNAQTRQYLFGSIFLAVGVYQLYLNDMLEFSLYACAGMAFVVNALVNEPRLFPYKRILVIIAWTLIIATGILFFYLLRYRFF